MAIRLSYKYNDPLLMNLVTEQNEKTAVADMAAYKPDFSDDDLAGIIPFRSYILCCIDNVKAADDMFATKKKMYEKELEVAINLARSKTKKGVPTPIFSIPIGRA